eukprot:COSAG05_NODE_5252_length_1225_cov_1.333925_2_plen_210_part_00
MSLMSRVESPRRVKGKRRTRRTNRGRGGVQGERSTQFARDRLGGVTDVSMSVNGTSIASSSPTSSPNHRTREWVELELAMGGGADETPPALALPHGLMPPHRNRGRASAASQSLDANDYTGGEERGAWYTSGSGAGSYAGTGGMEIELTPRRRHQLSMSASTTAASPRQVKSWLDWHEKQLGEIETDPTGGNGWQIPTASDAQQRVVIH